MPRLAPVAGLVGAGMDGRRGALVRRAAVCDHGLGRLWRAAGDGGLCGYWAGAVVAGGVGRGGAVEAVVGAGHLREQARSRRTDASIGGACAPNRERERPRERWFLGRGWSWWGRVAMLVWVAALGRPDGRLHVWFLDVGQGDGILIQTPAGRQVLVDGGASGQVLLGQLGAVMPFWDRTLDLVVLTHPDADHMAAQVEAAGRYGIEAAWETPASCGRPGERRLAQRGGEGGRAGAGAERRRVGGSRRRSGAVGVEPAGARASAGKMRTIRTRWSPSWCTAISACC